MWLLFTLYAWPLPAAVAGKSPQIDLVLQAVRAAEHCLSSLYDVADPVTILGSSKTMESLAAKLAEVPGNQLLFVVHEFSRVFAQLGQYKASSGGAPCPLLALARAQSARLCWPSVFMCIDLAPDARNRTAACCRPVWI